MRHGSSCGCPNCMDAHPDRFERVNAPVVTEFEKGRLAGRAELAPHLKWTLPFTLHIDPWNSLIYCSGCGESARESKNIEHGIDCKHAAAIRSLKEGK